MRCDCDRAAVAVRKCRGRAVTNWALPGDNTLRTRGDCLTAGAKSAGADVTLARCTGSARQFWVADGAITVPEKELVNAWSGKCLEGPHGPAADETEARLRPCHRAPAQTWYLPPDTR